MHKKGQASLEQMVITALGIGFIAIIFYLSLNISNDNTRISQAQDAVNKLAKTADYIYSLGPGSKDKIQVYMPNGMVFANLSEHTIHIRISLSSGKADVFANTKALLTGYLPQNSGPQEIFIEHTESGSVFFGESYIIGSPSSITKSFIQGGTGSDSITITNIGSFQLTGIYSNLTGNLADILSITQPEATLNSGSSDTIGLTFSVAADKTPGTYSGTVTTYASDNSETSTSITVFVSSSGGDDAQGPVVTLISHAPSNATSIDDITITATISDSTTGGNSISSSELEIDYSGIWNSMTSSDGSYDEITEDATLNIGSLEAGGHIIKVRGTDSLSNLGNPSIYSFTVDPVGLSQEDGSGPIVINISHTPYPTTFSNISVGGTATDEYTGNSTLQGCNVKIDSGDWIVVSAGDGAWDSASEAFSYNIGHMSVGQHYVYYQCTDFWGNIGSIHPDDFLIIDVDFMLVLDKSGSMSDYINIVSNNNEVSTSSSSFTLVKTLDVLENKSGTAKLTVELRRSGSSCTVYYQARIDGDVIASGGRSSSSYGDLVSYIDVSGYTAPYQIELWLRRSGSYCTAYNREFSLMLPPTKMNAVKNASKNFLDLATDSVQAGLVSYSDSASTNRVLAAMNEANKQTLKNSIDSLSPGGSTCIECGINNAVNELISARARPAATKAIILLSDGQSNVGNSINGAVYARNNNITIHTIGFGADVDSTELTNIAWLTNGEYYYAPDEETLIAIFNSLGRIFESVSD